jgi:hypothetical protein
VPYPVAAVRNRNFGGPLYSDLVLSLSPLAYWPLNETSGTTAVDLVGAHNGAYTGVDLGQAQTPFIAPLFDGTSDYCNIYSTWLNSNWNPALGSIAIWVKVYDAAVLTDGAIRDCIKLRADLQNFVDISRTATDNQFGIYYKAGNVSKSVTPTISATTWQHLALTWDVASNQMIAYVNGEQSGATQTSLGTWVGALSTSQTIIGANVTTPNAVWSGWLAHAAIWTRVLTPLEVAGLKSFFG